MSEDDHDYRKAPPAEPSFGRRYPPRHKVEPPPEGQDFDTLTAKHGRPRGPFEVTKPPRRDDLA